MPRWIIRLGQAIECMFDDHKFVRRSSVYWAWGLITYATLALFKDPAAISGPAAGAYATAATLLTGVIGLYQWDRTREDNQRNMDRLRTTGEPNE